MEYTLPLSFGGPFRVGMRERFLVLLVCGLLVIYSGWSVPFWEIFVFRPNSSLNLIVQYLVLTIESLVLTIVDNSI